MKISLLSRIDNKIPELLIYKNSKTDWYNMASTKTGALLGYMQTSDAFFKGTKALYIDGMYMEERRQGYGSKFLDFVKNLSKKEYQGTVFLDASSILEDDSGFEPHIFYRKNGFITDNKKILNKIDEAIEARRNLTIFDIDPTVMYWQDENK